jgi:uncharacterized membrane protein
MNEMDERRRDALDHDLVEVAAAPSQTGIMGRFRNYFLTGLIVAGPRLITVWLIWSFVSWVDKAVTPLIPPAYQPESYLPWPIPGTGLIVAVVALTLLGFLTANLVGRKFVELGESLLSRMPIVRPLYNTTKRIFESLFSKTGSTFRKVALVEFPAPGTYSLVFLSQPPTGELAAKLPRRDADYVSVFLPCTPNPTTGFFFFVQRKDLIELDIPVEAAMTLIISAGMVQPGDTQQKKLAALASTARAAQLARKPETVDQGA